MIKPITFCIPTAKNEKDYVLLLIDSLVKNTDISKHEILVFIDSDNQNTYETLLDKQKEISNLKLYRNTDQFPFGGQRNISIMFDAAKNDIVCYLQSDMVVGKDLDVHISNDLKDENDILSLTRIEPPLHPASPEKIVKDFGIDALSFDMNAFDSFVNELQSENRPIQQNAYFAPFALYKKTWFETLGGFDTQFRCSREDSDFIIRCKLNGINLIQTWMGAVYHFTCVSSRGKDWYKQNDEDVRIKNELQRFADYQELIRFIRKWGKFGHDAEYMYDIALVIDVDRYVDFNILVALEPYVSRIYLNDKAVRDNLVSLIKFNSEYFSNLRWNYSTDHWNYVMHRFNPTDFEDRIVYADENTSINEGVNLLCKYSDLHNGFKDAMGLFQNINDIIHDTDNGTYEFSSMKIHVKNKINKLESLKKLKTNWDILLNDPQCLFK
jgi:GT2 family glycosyltransferase